MKSQEKEQEEEREPILLFGKHHWELVVPWFLTLVSTIALAGIALFLFNNLMWLRDHSFSNIELSNLEYRSHAYHLYIASVRRAVGLFSGISLVFLGVGVSFYSIKSRSEVKFGSDKLSAGIITASPGIMAMALGVFLIAHNTASKDVIDMYVTRPIKGERISVPDTPPTVMGKGAVGEGNGDLSPTGAKKEDD